MKNSLISIFIILYSTIGHPSLSQEICSQSQNNTTPIDIETNTIHKIALKKIPSASIATATHQEYISYLEEYERQIGIRLQFSIIEIKYIFETSKELVLRAIQNEPSLPQPIKSQMFKTIQNSKFLLPSEYARIAPNENDAAYSLLMTCGFSKSYDNAFAISSQKWVVVCPGQLVRIALQPKSLRLFSALRGLSHELGHHIDSDSFDSYNHWFSCLNSAFSKLKASFEKYFGELSADYWASSAVLLGIESDSSGNDNFQLLKQSYSDICNSIEAPPAIAGTDRIDIVLRSNSIFNILFPNYTSQLSCLLK